MPASEQKIKESQGSGVSLASWRLGCLLLLLSGGIAEAQDIVNVSVVNVTPSSFSVVWGTPGSAPAISIFADPNGVTNLAGQVGTESYPLNSGNPALADAYDIRLNQQQLRQKTINQGLVYVQVSDCNPNTTYYYKLQGIDTNGQPASWPASGPLPAVTTAQQTSFTLDSQQLIFNLPGVDPSGSIVILSNSNTPSLLAAVAGDGVASNEVFFSVSDLIAATGNTNYLPLGNQQFTATVLGTSSNGVSQTYTLSFSLEFVVGQPTQSSLGDYAVLTLGSAIIAGRAKR